MRRSRLIKENNMFCQKCGAQLPENAKFCANCGAANEFAAQNNTVPQPVQNVEPIQPAQPIQPTQSAQPQNPTELLMNEYYKAAEPQTAAQQPSYSQEGSQPVRYTAEPVPLTPAPKKKRSKLIPGLCIVAGAVVVLGGAGAIVYNLNKASITRMIMGDANYAYSVAMQAASNLTVPDESMNAVVRSAMKAGVSPSAAENVIESAADAANGDFSYGDIVEVEPGSSSLDSGLSEIASALEFGAVYINELTGMSGAEVSVSGSLELDDSVMQMIRDSVGSEYYSSVSDIIDGVNTLKYTASEIDSGSAYEYALNITSEDDSIISAQIRYEEDGTLTMVLPGMSEYGVTAQLPAHSENVDLPEIPEYDVIKLYSKIDKELKAAFKEYDIECGNGEALVGGLKFSGLNVEIKLGKEEFAEIIQIVADAVSEDEELEEYLEAIDSSIDLDDIVESLNSTVDGIKDSSADFEAAFTFFVNSNNTLAGGKLSIESEGNTAEVAALSGEKDTEIVVSVNDAEYFAIRINGTSETEGKVEYDMTGLLKEAVMLRSENESADSVKYAIYMDYTDAGTVDIFGVPTAVGSYTLYMSSDLAEMISSGDNNLKQTLAKSKLSFSVQPQGKGAVCKLGADISGYGRGELVMSLDEPTGEVAPKPGSNYTLIDIENASEEDTNKMSEDITNYFTNLTESNKLIGAIYDLASVNMSQVGGYGDIDYDYDVYDDIDYYEDYYDYYDDYDDFDYYDDYGDYDLEYDIATANTTACYIKSFADSFLLMADLSEEPLNGLDSDGEVLKFRVENGVWSMESSTSSSFGDGSKAAWCNAVDSEYDFCLFVAEFVSDFQNGLVEIAIKNNECIGAAIIEGGTSNYPATNITNWERGEYDFTGKIPGLMSDGMIIGTYPELYFPGER